MQYLEMTRGNRHPTDSELDGCCWGQLETEEKQSLRVVNHQLKAN